jgi:hypothetical protein
VRTSIMVHSRLGGRRAKPVAAVAATAVLVLAGVALLATSAHGATGGPINPAPTASPTVASGLPIFTTIEASIPQFTGTAPIMAYVVADPVGAPITAAPPILVPAAQVTGSALDLPVPASAETAALASANGGVANMILTITNGTQISSVVFPARTLGMSTVSPSGTVSLRDAGSITRLGVISRPQTLSAATRRSMTEAIAAGSPDIGCEYISTTYSNNMLTRIGELHVAPISGMVGTYNYSTQADSSMSVGIESTGGTGFSDSGTASIDNSIGTGASDPHTDWANYVDDHMNFEKVVYSCESIIQAYSSNGDLVDNTASPRPGTDPWGKCESAPFFAEIEPGKGWGALNSSAITESWAFSAFNAFGGSGSTGYSTTNSIQYQNNSSKTTWVCGSGGDNQGLGGSPVIYNSLS